MEKLHRGTPSCDITWISLVPSHQISLDAGGDLRHPRGRYSDLVDAHDVLFTEDVVPKVEDLWGTENLKPSRTRGAAIASTKDAK